MHVSYLSDTEPDYKYLEEYLASGIHGNLPDTMMYQEQHDLRDLNELMEKFHEKIPWLSKKMRDRFSF